MTAQPANPLTAAISMREGGRTREAKDLLVALHRENPDDPQINLQCAWAHDKLGLEREAVPYYEAALQQGLEGEDLRNAQLGLGSTYRLLGEYENALSALTRAVRAFPDDHALKVFHAMALYNNDKPKEACEVLLAVINETSSDEAILAYRDAIALYAADLDRTWK